MISTIRKMDVFSAILLVLLAGGLASATHFRGGTWQWKPIMTDSGDFTGKAEVTSKMTFNGFRNGGISTDSHQKCQSISNTKELETKGFFECKGCRVQVPRKRSTSSPDMTWYCTDLSIDGNWDVGGKTFTVQPTKGTTKAVIFYDQCCWVDPIQNVSPGTHLGWRMNTEINLSPRTDNNEINSSPITAPLPVQRFHRGCRYWLEIPVTDPDNDVYRCRNTRKDLNECYMGANNEEMCGPLTNVTVYDNCTLLFNTNGSAGWYAVRVMIEDLYASGPDKGKPLSKISLSFLLQVDPDNSTCDTPVIVEPKRVCKTIHTDQVFEMNVIAQAATDTLPIVRIETQKPIGMTSSELQDVPGNPLQKSVTLTWTPTKKDRYQLGFNAIDKSGFSSSWSFVSLNVVDAVEPVSILRGDSYPAEGEVVDSLKGWRVKYNSRIKRPTHSANITLLDDAGKVVDILDSSIAQQVEFRNKTVVFNVNLATDAFHGEREFTLRIDDGVALDESYEDCTFNAQGDEWQIRINGTSDQAEIPTEEIRTAPPAPSPSTPVASTPAPSTPVASTPVPSTTVPPKKFPPTFECESRAKISITGKSEGKRCFLQPEKNVFTVTDGTIDVPVCCETTCTAKGNATPTYRSPGSR